MLMVLCVSEACGPSDLQSPHGAARSAEVLVAWSAWVHSAVRCLCSLAEAMSNHGVAPKPWAFGVTNNLQIMESLHGDATLGRDMLVNLLRSPIYGSVYDADACRFLKKTKGGSLHGGAEAHRGSGRELPWGEWPRHV